MRSTEQGGRMGSYTTEQHSVTPANDRNMGLEITIPLEESRLALFINILNKIRAWEPCKKER